MLRPKRRPERRLLGPRVEGERLQEHGDPPTRRTTVRGAIGRLRRAGVRRVLRCRAERVVIGALRRYYRFDRWHAEGVYSCRPYKRTVVELVNGLAPSTVVEIGSGLGDILSRVRAPRRRGYDIDPAVVRAARFLHGRRVSFVTGGAADVEEERIDVLIMVNWIHNLSPVELESLLRPLVPRTLYLVLDAIDESAPETYRYRHDFAFLSTVADRISVTRPRGESRSFHLFRVRPAIAT